MWQAVASIAALITALGACAVGIAGYLRSSRAEDARSSAEAAAIGLDYVKTGIAEQRQAMEAAIAHQQDVIREQQGMIGELRGELKGCREERQVMAAKIAELEGRIP